MIYIQIVIGLIQANFPQWVIMQIYTNYQYSQYLRYLFAILFYISTEIIQFNLTLMNQQKKGSQMSSQRIFKQQTVKIIFVGKSGVGKTSLFRRFQGLHFNQNQTSTITDCQQMKTNYKLQNEELDLRLYDSPGQQRFIAYTVKQLAKNHGVVMIYAINNNASFKAIQQWVDNIIKYGNHSQNTPMILIGNKQDLEDNREVQKTEGVKLAKKLGIPFFQNSAKNETNISQEVQTLVRKIMVKKNEMESFSVQDIPKKIQRRMEKKQKITVKSPGSETCKCNIY